MRDNWYIIDDKNIKKDEKYDFENDINLVFKEIDVKKEVVLCIGKVQSGKTNKIFAIIEKALNNFNYDIAIILAGTTNYLVNQTNHRLKKQKNNSYNYLFTNEVIDAKYKENKKYILSILKNDKGLKSIYNFLYSINNLKDKKILIIDDECDFGSINIKENEYSLIYSWILKIYDFIYNGKLIQVTATPFANISSKKSNELLANRIICWSNPKKYTGLFEFNEQKESIYQIIDCNKKDFLTYKKYVENTIKYFISTIINNYEVLSKYNELTCLFNVDLDIKTHIIITQYLYLTIKNIKKSLETFYKKNIDSKNIDYECFQNRIIKVFENIQIIELNNKTKKQKPKKQFNIFVGGTLISRENTFENLITEMIINNPRISKINVDTLLQRCRWFGYRKDIMKYMKIFMSNEIYEALIESNKYVELLLVGEHSYEKLYREIKILDTNSYIVKSTGKE